MLIRLFTSNVNVSSDCNSIKFYFYILNLNKLSSVNVEGLVVNTFINYSTTDDFIEIGYYWENNYLGKQVDITNFINLANCTVFGEDKRVFTD